MWKPTFLTAFSFHGRLQDATNPPFGFSSTSPLPPFVPGSTQRARGLPVSTPADGLRRGCFLLQSVSSDRGELIIPIYPRASQAGFSLPLLGDLDPIHAFIHSRVSFLGKESFNLLADSV